MQLTELFEMTDGDMEVCAERDFVTQTTIDQRLSHEPPAAHRIERCTGTIPYRTVIAIARDDLKTGTADGEVTVTHLEPGTAYWQAPMPPGLTHRDVNETDKTIVVVNEITNLQRNGSPG